MLSSNATFVRSGVEHGGAGLERDADTGSDLVQAIDGGLSGRAHIGGGDDADRAAALG